MDLDGWHPDPCGTHEERFFEHGEPTALVRDGGVGSYDDPPASIASASAAAPTHTPMPTATSENAPGVAGSRRSGPTSGHLRVTRHWWFWVTAFALVSFIALAIAVFGGKQAANDGSNASTAFCVKAPHNAPCPDSYLRSQEALLHDFWEAYLTGSACYPQHCPGNKAELLVAAASTAKKWLPEVQGSRATTAAAEALSHEIGLVLAGANAKQQGGGSNPTAPTTPPLQTTATT